MRTTLSANGKRILILAAALVCGMAIGFAAGRLSGTAGEKIRQTGNVGVVQVLPETQMERAVTFTRCGHRLTVPIETNAFVGYTKEELAGFYADYEIASFSAERVTVTQTVEGCCPRHVLLREDGDGALSVYRTDETFFSEQLVRSVPFEGVGNLTEDERARLKTGIPFDTLMQIDLYLESMES